MLSAMKSELGKKLKWRKKNTETQFSVCQKNKKKSPRRKGGGNFTEKVLEGGKKGKGIICF